MRETRPPDPDTFRNRLRSAVFTAELILGALGIFKTCREQRPHKNYDHAYYGGILRNITDDRHIQLLATNLETVYTNHWETMGSISKENLALSLHTHPLASCLRLCFDYCSHPIPAYGNLILIDLMKCFLVASQASAKKTSELRKAIIEKLISWSGEDRKKRALLVRSFFEWENFIRLAGAQQ